MTGWLRRFWRWAWGEPSVTPAEAASQQIMKVSDEALRRAYSPAPGTGMISFASVFAPAKPPPGIPAADASGLVLAADTALAPMFAYAGDGWFQQGIGFLGYPYLAELTQRAEYRVISETRAKEMTRKWIELEYVGDEPDDSRLTKIMDSMDREFHLRDVFRKAAEQEGIFGASTIYIDTGATDNPKELMTRLILKPQKIRKGGLRAFRNIDTTWVYPNDYNATDPLKPDYFKPNSWWIMGKRVHRTRLLRMVSREMPDLLKPAYAFGGLSLSQMAKPYVDNWLRARQSVSDLMHAFSIIVLATNMQSTLQGGDGMDLFARLDMFNALRDNRGSFAIDKESEDIKNLAVPLGTLDKLQAQAQEQQASVSQTPLVKLLGVTPSGLNASSDGEIRVFYDLILSLQEAMFADPLRVCIDLIQLHLFGDIDPNVRFKFVPLYQLDEAGEAVVAKTEADIDALYVQSGIIDPEEVRERLASDPHSKYANLDVSDLPDMPDDEPEPNTSGDPAKQAEPRGEEREPD